MSVSKDINLRQRVADKAASREADRLALESGEKTVDDLNRENGAFGFPRNRIRLNLSRTRHY